MNDFLHKMRNNTNTKDKKYSRQRGRNDNYGNGNNGNGNGYSQYNGTEKRQGNDRRSKGYRDNQSAITKETLSTLKHLLEDIVDNQELLVQNSERRAVAEERKASAIEDMVHYLKEISIGKLAIQPEHLDLEFGDEIDEEEEWVLAEDDSEAIEEEPKPVAAKAKTVKRRKKRAKKAVDPLKEEVMGIIFTMRDNGSTYDQIASHLKDAGYDTFSGRGQWHAQTIHRLCQDNK